MNLFLCLLTALLLAFSFPKFSLSFLAFLAFLPFLKAIEQAQDLKRVLFYGGLTGFLFFLINLSWLTTLFTWASYSIYLGWILLSLLQALSFMLFAAAVRYFSIKRVFLLSFVWIVLEWLRTLGPFGITAGGLVYAQANFIPLIQLAAFLGPYAISFVIILFNLLLYRRKFFAAFLLIASLLTLGGVRLLTFTSPPLSHKVAIIQANISQARKLEYQEAYHIFQEHYKLSQKVKDRDLIVWPETAITRYLLRERSLLFRLKRLADYKYSGVIVGAPHFLNSKAYNSCFSFSKEGKLLSRYDKEHLVPFGEYLPFRKLLWPFFKDSGLFDGDYTSAKDVQLLKIDGANLASLICFESTFPSLVRRRVLLGGEAIIVITNDAWFFESAALSQHLNAAPLRAVENGKYLVQAANTGVSAIIDPLGRGVKKLETGEKGVLLGDIGLIKQKTLYTRLGDLIVYLGILILGFNLVRRRGR